jgi:hypothetical protein
MPPLSRPGAFRIGRRAGPTRLPIVVELPLPGGPLVLATREPWPVAKDLFCSELAAWPADAEEIERVPVASCRRVGASVQLVLDRGQRRRSLFVWTTKQGRSIVFWRSERSMRATRPGVRAPTARGLDGPLEVVVDLRERYAWRFADLPVTVERRRLPVGDYAAFVDGRLVAVVERKRLEEFAGAAVQGRLQLQLAELATMPRAVVVIEGRLSQLLKGDLKARPGWLLNLVAALQAAYPNVPLLFAETGPLAAGLAYRWLSAASRLARAEAAGEGIAEVLSAALGVEPPANPPADQPADALAAAPLFAAAPAVQVLRASTASGREGRLRDALERARAGEPLTIRAHAARHGVDPTTGSLDLNGLVRDGLLRAEGHGRARRFLATE